MRLCTWLCQPGQCLCQFSRPRPVLATTQLVARPRCALCCGRPPAPKLLCSAAPNWPRQPPQQLSWCRGLPTPVQRSRTARPYCAAPLRGRPPHLPCCAVLPPIGHASRPAPTARPAEFAGAASYTWTLIRMHAHTHARRQAQTHLKALAAASRPPANPNRRQQHASRTGRYSKCGRHWAGPARGGAGYALQPIFMSVGASSVSYRAIAPR